MLETLITSKTRLKMLLKFFTNSNATAYLRGLSDEFGDSTNSIRVELNKLSEAGYLTYSEKGRTIEYRANTKHPLFPEIKNLVHKYLGIDQIIINIIQKLGDLRSAYIIGDYAIGKDSGTIELLLVGEIDIDYLKKLIDKVRKLIQRNIKVEVISKNQLAERKLGSGQALLLWEADL
ncbi:MAG: ArsR family transcriptional regulator [Cyclobacteriaceae bacterium]